MKRVDPTEGSMKSRVIEYFFGRGFPYFFEEIPFLTRSIDLCFFDPGTDRIVSVELKVKKWQDALRQARVYQLFSDESYVVLHTSFAHRADVGQFSWFGIGLISFAEDPKIYCPAAPSPIQKRRFRVRIHDLLTSTICKESSSAK